MFVHPTQYRFVLAQLMLAVGTLTLTAPAHGENGGARVYDNRLTPIKNPQPLLNDHPDFVQPIIEERRFEARPIIDEDGADLEVRAWRFSYNARGIIEMPNRIKTANTAVICVHPWGIDESHGWITPEPAGVADFCTPNKNRLAAEHTRTVIDPLLKRLRPGVGLVMYSLRGHEYPVHTKLYRSIRKKPTEAEREEGHRELEEILGRFDYHGSPLPKELKLSDSSPVKDYFEQFPGLDAGPKYDPQGFWDLPIPICDSITVSPDDYVYYDEDGYPALRDFLKAQHIRHILLVGYATDMCFGLTTCGYKNLEADFNVFLVGDATLATFPANITPKYATNAHISFASLTHLITQTSWIKSAAKVASNPEKN
jgi:nicotinamidase-related amidase